MTATRSETEVWVMPARVYYAERLPAEQLVLVLLIFSVVPVQLIAETIPVSVHRFFGYKFLCPIVVFACETPARAVQPRLCSE